MAPKVKYCPLQHELAADSKICLNCGWEFSLSSITPEFHGFRILEEVKIFKRHFYRVQRDQEEFVLAESLEFLNREFREQACLRLNKHPSQPILDWFHHSWQNVVYLYFKLRPEVWTDLQHSLRHQLDQQGLLTEAQLLTLLQSWQETERFLQEQYLIQPAWSSNLMPGTEARGLQILNLDLLCPDSDLFPVPEIYLGYHNFVPLLRQKNLSFNRRLEISSRVSVFMEILTGMPPDLWYPQPLSLNGFRTLFSRETWPRVAAVLEHPTEFSLNQPIRYQREQFEAVKASNLFFFQGLEQYHRKEYEKALSSFARAHQKYLVSSHIPFMMANACFQLEQFEDAQDMVTQAMRIETLACHALLQAKISLQQKDMLLALRWLERAVTESVYYPEAWALLGQSYEQSEQFSKAKKSLEQAYAQRKSPAILQLLSRVKTQRGKTLKNGQAFGLKGGRSSYFQPQTIRALFTHCRQGHQTDLTLINCQVCQEALTLQAGQKIGSYTIERVIQNREEDHPAWKGALYLCRGADQQAYVLKEFLTWEESQKFRRHHAFILEVQHPNLLPLVDILEQKNCSYLAFPYLEGKTLAELLESSGPLNEAAILNILVLVGSALEHLQRRTRPLTHADLKPENLYFTEQGQVLLIDVESLYPLDAAAVERPIIFTLPFSPPEQAETSELNGSSASYALAVSMIQAATGLGPELFYDPVEKCFRDWQKYAPQISAALAQELDGLCAFRLQDRTWLTVKRLQDWLAWRKKAQTLECPEKNKAMVRLVQQLRSLETHQVREVQGIAAELLQIQRNSLTSYIVGTAHRKVGNLRGALQFFQLSYRLQKWRIQAVWQAVEIAFARKSFNLALQLLKELRGSAYEHPQTLLLLARTYRELNALRLSLVAYEKLVELWPHNLPLKLELAGFYLEKQLFTKAEQFLFRLLDKPLPPQFMGEAQHMLGLSLARKGDDEAAQVYFLQALSFQPSKVALLFDLGINYYHLRNWKQASTYFQRCLEIRQDDNLAHYYLGICLMEQKQFETAWEHLQRVHPETSLSLESIQFQQARLLTLRGQWDAAYALYLVLLEKNKSPAIFVNLVNLALLREQKQEALSFVSQGLHYHPQTLALQNLKEQLRQAS